MQIKDADSTTCQNINCMLINREVLASFNNNLMLDATKDR